QHPEADCHRQSSVDRDGLREVATRKVSVASRILVVEDEALIAEDIQRTLQRFGYEVPITAATASQAFRAIESARPDLVLMAIRLKGPMDGITAAKEITTRFAVPIVYLTSHSDEMTLSRLRESRPRGYLVKPFRIEDLQSTVEKALSPQ